MTKRPTILASGLAYQSPNIGINLSECQECGSARLLPPEDIYQTFEWDKKIAEGNPTMMPDDPKVPQDAVHSVVLADPVRLCTPSEG
ncbi:uncharacterized protein H6S33_001924 [Morchella sextelata]|uniref:uncharacterized protein n=1 Tax=Morchella sextelata TaxID=1174677 RepID=UPI001D03C86C|nr:uncharacterized protein H6S33_001924 [Morchella sextelata]KAH0607872.1 hypothetical protein H6S33_001924 [Morchella sextelata]